MEGFGLPQWIVTQCNNLKMVEATPIQKATIPDIMKGKDVLGVAPTGTGKTACYVLPILSRFAMEPQLFIAVVLSPTRELASQVRDQVVLFGEKVRFSVALVVGGADFTQQKEQLLTGGAHMVIGTPGRLKEMVSDPDVAKRMRRIKFAVLDEVDRLVQSPMDEEVMAITDTLGPKRQMLLFTATLDAERDKVLKMYGSKDMCEHNLVAMGHRADMIKHQLIVCPAVASLHYLYHVLQSVKPFCAPFRGIIFVRTIEDTEHLRETLLNLGEEVTCLNSLQDAKVRTSSLAKFRREERRILVATDVASRGLDLPALNFVINFNIPKFFEDYCHRVGRCARAGRPGTALTFVIPRLVRHDIEADVSFQRIQYIQERLGMKIQTLVVDERAAQKQTHKIAKAEAAARVILADATFSDRLQRRKKRRQEELTASQATKI